MWCCFCCCPSSRIKSFSPRKKNETLHHRPSSYLVSYTILCIHIIYALDYYFTPGICNVIECFFFKKCCNRTDSVCPWHFDKKRSPDILLFFWSDNQKSSKSLSPLSSRDLFFIRSQPHLGACCTCLKYNTPQVKPVSTGFLLADF